MNIAFFDFDHTISTKDSFLDFVAFSKGKTSLYLSLCILAPFLIIYKARLYSGQKIKELVLSYHFKGMNQDEFDQLCEQYGRERINVIINNKASDRIKWHQENNHRIVVVSASIENWLRYWCEQNCLELIGSRLAIEEGKLSGKLLGKNCNEEEKVRRIKSQFDLTEFDEIYAYGNSKGDLPMLSLANHKHYKYF